MSEAISKHINVETDNLERKIFEAKSMKLTALTCNEEAATSRTSDQTYANH